MIFWYFIAGVIILITGGVLLAVRKKKEPTEAEKYFTTCLILLRTNYEKSPEIATRIVLKWFKQKRCWRDNGPYFGYESDVQGMRYRVGLLYWFTIQKKLYPEFPIPGLTRVDISDDGGIRYVLTGSGGAWVSKLYGVFMWVFDAALTILTIGIITDLESTCESVAHSVADVFTDNESSDFTISKEETLTALGEYYDDYSGSTLGSSVIDRYL